MSTRAGIIHQPNYESRIVKILNRCTSLLTEKEISATEQIKIPTEVEAIES